MFTFVIYDNGREVENLGAGVYATEAEAEGAGLTALEDLCPAGSPNRKFYRVIVARC